MRPGRAYRSLLEGQSPVTHPLGVRGTSEPLLEGQSPVVHPLGVTGTSEPLLERRVRQNRGKRCIGLRMGPRVLIIHPWNPRQERLRCVIAVSLVRLWENGTTSLRASSRSLPNRSTRTGRATTLVGSCYRSYKTGFVCGVFFRGPFDFLRFGTRPDGSRTLRPSRLCEKSRAHTPPACVVDWDPNQNLKTFFGALTTLASPRVPHPQR